MRSEKNRHVSIHKAITKDIETLCALDPTAKTDVQRRNFITRVVDADSCWIALEANQVVGYCALENTFYDQGFISILYVHPQHRRQGIGSTLVLHLESNCKTPKIFTSTNLSNLIMQALLNQSGYTLAGVIHHLDKNDPEIVYVKYLEANILKLTVDVHLNPFYHID